MEGRTIRIPRLHRFGWAGGGLLFLLLFLLLGGGFFPAFGQTILNEEFWYEYQPEIWLWDAEKAHNPIPDLRSFTQDELFQRILEEARYVLSGMVYGFTFSYTPYDKSRKVEEEFLLEPYQWIQKGDPNLSVVGVRVEGTRVYVRVRYALVEFQEAWYRGLRSNVLPSASGFGQAPFYQGPEGRMRAVQEGIKNAIREYARTVMYNKPHTLKGLVVLDAAPRMMMDSGLYKAVVNRAILRLEDMKRYRMY